MKLTWWGTAGFHVNIGRQAVLVDPYLSRNAGARPKQPMVPTDIKEADHIFLSHGHFDHIYDIPVIASQTGSIVHCCPVAANTLNQRGLKKNQIRVVNENGYTAESNKFKAQAYFSQHVKFDPWLLIKTLLRINIRIPKYLPLMREYPVGQVLSWRFTIGDQVIQHFGSAGSTPEELNGHSNQPIDILLIPLQGHSRICNIALNYVQALKPRMVIPHHQDDFFPPISTYVDVRPFARKVAQRCPHTKVRIMRINESITI